jgi:hypothetical protein
MNIFGKDNKAVADAAKQVLQNSTMKIGPEAAPKPIESNLVDQVVKSNLNTFFHKVRTSLKEQSGDNNKALHNASSDDPTSHHNNDAQKAKLDQTPIWPKAKKPLEHNKTTSSSAEDGTMSLKSVTNEGWREGMENDYAMKMRAPTYAKEAAKKTIKKLISKKGK